MPLTAKQTRFVEEYLVDVNGAAAARRAGYAPDGAGNAAWRLLQNREVRQALEARMAQRAQQGQVKQEEVLLALREVAFAPGSDANGATVKLASKLRALELLGRHLGMFDGGGKSPATVTILEDVAAKRGKQMKQ